MNRPQVSAIITTKNEEGNIGRLLQSIKDQSYKEIETIVVDNKSSDRTKEIARSYTKNVYDRGPERSAQRNFGAQEAKGTYLLILDADMELTPRVVEDCVRTAQGSRSKLLVVPEKTIGTGLISKIRQFEREMYIGDLDFEVARFFDKKTFFEFGGYDPRLTGPEDYDLPYRISKKYKIGRSNQHIFHHEENLSLSSLLKKRLYYASRGAFYAEKHPELIKTQGNLLFRKAYLRNWKKFAKHPFLGLTFIGVRTLETLWAVYGFIQAVGISGFKKALLTLLK